MQNLKMLLLAVSNGKAEEDTSIAAKMMYLSCQQSELRIMFESEGIDLDRQSSTWTKLDATDVASGFPQLFEEKKTPEITHLEHIK